MFFFDTYALCEIVEGNPAYSRFVDEPIVTSILNGGELYYFFLKDSQPAKAEAWFELLRPNLTEVDPATMKQAMRFKHTHKKKKLSMVDCVGYMLAKKLNARFLTGDEAFKNIAGVEFVK
jgi:predicted nucleic acid-binding protein